MLSQHGRAWPWSSLAGSLAGLGSISCHWQWVLPLGTAAAPDQITSGLPHRVPSPLSLRCVYVPSSDGHRPDPTWTSLLVAKTQVSLPFLEPQPRSWLLKAGAVGNQEVPRFLEESAVLSLFSLPPAPQLMIFNVGATVLYITAFIACSAAVELTSLKGTRPYNQRAAASVSMVPQGALGS